MITPDYIRMMARYNQWQNASILGAAATLGDEDRKTDRGAFFGSIHGTLCHLLWGDEIWMHRFAGTPKPDGGIAGSPDLVADWDGFVTRRHAFDAVLLNWSATVEQRWLQGDHTWFSGAMGHDVTRPVAALVVHMFNHQTHHRGQVHAMLTAAGGRPGATDLAFMP